jgi:hypothetical protein
MATPPRSAPATSPRGSFRVKQSYPGVAMFKSFTCQDHLYETRVLPEHVIGDGFWVIDQMNANLNHADACPADPQQHGAVCPFDRHRVSVVVERSLSLVRPTTPKPPAFP